MNNTKNKIGVLGGSFDPAHKGHLAISQEAFKRLRLNKIIWAITKKNPLGAYFYDTFGNRTSSLTISSKQLTQIEKILNQ